MESVSLRLYSVAMGKHPNINVETQIPLELGINTTTCTLQFNLFAHEHTCVCLYPSIYMYTNIVEANFW